MCYCIQGNFVTVIFHSLENRPIQSYKLFLFPHNCLNLLQCNQAKITVCILFLYRPFYPLSHFFHLIKKTIRWYDFIINDIFLFIFYWEKIFLNNSSLHKIRWYFWVILLVDNIYYIPVLHTLWIWYLRNKPDIKFWFKIGDMKIRMVNRSGLIKLRLVF